MSKNPIVKIRQIRELKGFSQEYMAQRLSISQRSFSKLERQETKLDWKRIAQIASIFDMNPIELVTFDDSTLFKKKGTKKIPVSENNRLTEKLIEQYEKRIQNLESEIQFLRTQLSKK